MRRTLSILPLLAFTLAGCTDGGETPPANPTHFGLAKVSGDAQSDTVVLTGLSATVARLDFQGVPEGDMLPNPMVVKIVPLSATGSLDRANSGAHFDLLPTGPSRDVAALPTVTWSIPQERCGQPVTATAQPRSDLTVSTFVAKGTKAGTCTLRAQIVEKDSSIMTQEFSYTLLAGPPRYGLAALKHGFSMPKLPLTFGKYLVMDANLNAVPYRIVAEAPLQVAGDTLGTEAARRVEVGPGTDPQVVYSRHIWVIATTQSDTVAEADISWDASSLHSVMWTAAALPYHWTPDGSLH